MLARTYSATTHGSVPYIVEVEVDTIFGQPKFVIIGLPTQAVAEAKERITSALVHCGVKIKARRTVVNLAPADRRKDGSCLELAIAVALLVLYGRAPVQSPKTLYLGELSLNGALKPIRGALLLVLAAKNLGFIRVIVPEANAAELALVSGIEIVPVATLQDLLDYFSHKMDLPSLKPATLAQLKSLNKFGDKSTAVSDTLDFADIIGQATAKRGLELAAAGGHHVLMTGPPGTGKSMLANRFCTILPPLTEAEALEVTALHSLRGLNRGQLITLRPMRSPHHTISKSGLLGGGSTVLPGEVSLAHRGILFLDELPEFSRDCIESLRQPLETGSVTLTRAQESFTFPSRYSLVAAANPCPCGYYQSHLKPCRCSRSSRQAYQQKLSGPLLDRIDISLFVNSAQTMLKSDSAETSSEILTRVLAAREFQETRYKDPNLLNAHLTSVTFRSFCKVSDGAESLLQVAANKLHLSTRGVFSVLRVAQTCADLDKAAIIEPQHVAEALQFRHSQPV